MKPVDILTGPTPSTAKAKKVDFSGTPMEGNWAITIDDLLTPAECENLLSLVEPTDGQQWPPATITTYGGQQVFSDETRRCGRIIYSSPEVAEALLRRIMPFLPEDIVTLKHGPVEITGVYPALREETWRITGLKDGLRFLKYGVGDYFRPHCDAMYSDGQFSFLTVHLYLNHEGLEGGATSFLADYMDPDAGGVRVNPKTGSVLIFQQKDMVHEGCEVTKGTKYTLRTDVVYEKVE